MADVPAEGLRVSVDSVSSSWVWERRLTRRRAGPSCMLWLVFSADVDDEGVARVRSSLRKAGDAEESMMAMSVQPSLGWFGAVKSISIVQGKLEARLWSVVKFTAMMVHKDDRRLTGLASMIASVTRAVCTVAYRPRQIIPAPSQILFLNAIYT